MLRRTILILGSLLLAAFPSSAVAQSPGPGSSTATGVVTGETSPPQPGAETLSYTATGSPTSATGAISYQSGTGVNAIVVEATPICIGVLDNRAFIVGNITSSTDPGPGGFSVGESLVIR